MANKKTTNSKRFDFLPNKQNKYSIRKFTVGTASILVGATLVFGAYNDAQAEELDSKTTEEAAATEEEPADEAAVTEEAATTEEQAVDTADTSKEETTTEEAPKEETAVTEEADTTAEQPAEETTKSASVITAAETTEEATTAEQPASTTTETTPSSDATAEEAPATTPETTTEQPAAVPTTDIKTVTDQTSAADYLAAEKNISTEEANKIASNLNGTLTEVTPEALQQALVDYLANEQNKYNVDGTLAAVREETALTNEDVVTEEPVSTAMFRSAPTTATRAADTTTSTRAFDSELQQAAQDGALYVPGVEGQKQSYAGKAWIYRGGNINSPGNEPLQNAKIYLQWVNGDGFVSPVYYTTTNPDGSYVFDLSKSVIDSTGKEQKFQLAGDGNFAVRTWVENPDPEKYNVIKHGDQKYGFHTRTSRTNESWDFTAGVNRIVNGQVLVQEKISQNDWLMKPKDQWTESPNADGIWPNEGLYGKVTGKVWYETNDPSGSDSRAWKKDSWDLNATGVKVVASYVNDEVTRQFDAWKEANKGYTLEDFRAAQQDIVTKYQAENGQGSHIAESVVGTVDSNGNYYIPFKGLYGVSATQQNSGLKISHTITDEEYGQLVKDEDVNHSSLLQWNGTIGQKHRHINSDYMYIAPMIDDYAIWGNNYQNNMFTTADAGRDIFDAQMLAGANGSGQDFAALAPQPMHDVLVYDSQKNFAVPGDTVESKSGGLLPSREYQIQWFKDGVAIGDPVSKVSNVDGTIGSVPITVPADLDKNATYTSAIFLPNRSTTDLSDALAVDSFTAVVDQNIINEPAYEDTSVAAGEEGSVTPTFTDKNGNPVETSNVPLDAEAPFILDPNATDVPEGVKVDPKTGEITFTPTPDQVGQEITVPVVVTYEDGTTDTVNAKFTVTAPTPDADKYDPTATPEEVEKGGDYDLTDNVDTKGLPEGTTVKDVTPTGTIDTNTPGEYPGKVEVTYPDGSKDTVDVPVTVKPSQADENDPTVTPEEVEKGGEYDLTDNVDTSKLPDGTKVTDVTPDGTIDTNTPGDYTGKVEVTYPDGSKETVDVPVKVNPSQADQNDPTATPEVVEQGGTVDLTDNVDTKGLPEGTTVKDVTPEGSIDTDKPGEYTGKVEVTYPDGSKDTVDVPVTVTEKAKTQAEQNDPTATPEVVEQGGKVDLTDNVDTKGLPEGTKVVDVTPEGSIDTDKPGEYTGTVEVVYPDGSKDTIEVPVTVKEKLTDADQNDPTATPEVVEQGGTVDLTDNVDTKGLPEGTTVKDVTPEGSIDTDKPGEYTGKVEVTYPDGSKDTVDVPVTVKEKLTDADKNDPTATPEVVEQGGTVDLTDNVDTKGLPEGTTVKDVTPEGSIDTDKPGEYTGKVEVTYPDGSKDTVDVPVTVTEKAKTQAEQNDPTATPEVVEQGGTVDLTDNVDTKGLPEGTIVKDVTPEGSIDTDKPGEYTGTVEVVYPDGSKDTIEVPVTVKEKLTDADKNDPTVTPEVVEQGGKVDLTDNVDLTDLPDGTKVTDVTPEGSIDTDKTGDYTGKVEITYPDGSKETVDVPVKVQDTTAPNAPTVKQPQPGDDVITGTAEPNGTVDVTLPNGDVIKDVPVDADGNYKVDVPEGVELKEGDKITVVAKDDSGNVSDPTETTVTDTVAPDAPTVNQPQPGDDVITGTAEPNGTVDVTLPNGDVIKDVPVDADGNYKVDVPEGVELKEGDKVTVVAKDGNGNMSDPTETTVTDTVAPDAPTVTNPQPGDKVITGTAEPNGTVDVTLPNGDVIKDVPVDADGNYKVDVPEGVELKEGDKVTVVAKDGNGNTSTPTEGTVTDTVAPDAPTVTNPQPGDKVITGTAEPNGTVDVTLPNGDVIKDVPVDADGNYKVDVPEGVELKEGDKVTVVAKDGNGNTSTPTEGTVTDTVAPDAPTVDPVKAGDTEVTGKGEPGSTIIVTFPDGTEGTTTVDKDGNWTVKVPDGTTIKPGDELDVTATDEAGNKSDVTKVKVPDTDKDTVAPDAPTVDPVKAGDTEVTGKGEPGSTITVKFPDGKEGTTTVDKDGNWTVKVPDGTTIKPGDELEVTATDEAGNKSDVTKVKVPDTDKDTVAPDAPTVNPVQPGDTMVTGKGEPGSTITVKFPDGKEGTATVDKDGNWTVKVPDGTMIKEGDKLIVTATDEAGNTSEPTEVIVKGMKDNGKTDMNDNMKDMNGMDDMDNMNDMPGMKDDMKASKDMNNKGKEMKELPETGNESTNAPLFGSLIAAFGSLFLLGRRRKEDEEK